MLRENDMKIISQLKSCSTHRSYRLSKIVLFVLCLACLLLLVVQWRLVVPTVVFFYQMKQLPPLWTEGGNDNIVETYPLDDAKQIAVFLLEQSEEDRRRMIAMYQNCIKVRSWEAGASALPTASKLYILLRLLYDVPERYPRDQAKFFGGWKSLLVREDGSLTMGVPTPHLAAEWLICFGPLDIKMESWSSRVVSLHIQGSLTME